jgi:hypothetical protein
LRGEFPDRAGDRRCPGIPGNAWAGLGAGGRRAAVHSEAASGGGQAGEKGVKMIIGRYIYLPMDTPASLFFMKSQKMSSPLSRQQEYARSKRNSPRSGGSAKAMSRIVDRKRVGPVIRGHAKSKVRPFMWRCPRSSMTGSSKRLLTGGPCRRLSARCNDSAVRSCLNPCLIQNAANDSAREFWGSFRYQSP